MRPPNHADAQSVRLARNQRIRSDREIREAYAQGRRWVGRYMVLWLRSGPGAALRLGVVSSRKVGNAVARNRARRRVREAFRVNRRLMEGDLDIVIVARRKIGSASAGDVESELIGLARRAGLIRKDNI